MWRAWEWREKCNRFWWESQKEKDHSEDVGIDGIRMDLTEIVGVKWIQLAQDRDRCRAFMNAVMNRRVIVPQLVRSHCLSVMSHALLPSSGGVNGK
jgi:hypothetical protein